MPSPLTKRLELRDQLDNYLGHGDATVTVSSGSRMRASLQSYNLTTDPPGFLPTGAAVDDGEFHWRPSTAWRRRPLCEDERLTLPWRLTTANLSAHPPSFFISAPPLCLNVPQKVLLNLLDTRLAAEGSDEISQMLHSADDSERRFIGFIVTNFIATVMRWV